MYSGMLPLWQRERGGISIDRHFQPNLVAGGEVGRVPKGGEFDYDRRHERVGPRHRRAR